MTDQQFMLKIGTNPCSQCERDLSLVKSPIKIEFFRKDGLVGFDAFCDWFCVVIYADKRCLRINNETQTNS